MSDPQIQVAKKADGSVYVHPTWHVVVTVATLFFGFGGWMALIHHRVSSVEATQAKILEKLDDHGESLTVIKTKLGVAEERKG